MNEKDSEQFKHLQETLGTLMLALNWPGWTDEDRATLLRCIDCLARKLIDTKQGSDIQNPAVGAEHPR